jgi:very-short-patch-repair endonuclease
MLIYNRYLKPAARLLRRESTESEKILWKHLRHRQLGGVQFYRQKPIGPYLVDFYCASAKLAVELDGGYHRNPIQQEQDEVRDSYLRQSGLRILRFENAQIQRDIPGVLKALEEQIRRFKS